MNRILNKLTTQSEKIHECDLSKFKEKSSATANRLLKCAALLPNTMWCKRDDLHGTYWSWI